MSYTLLFDGQCKICRYLIKNFVQPNQPTDLKVKPYQEAQFEKNYPETELKRCESEIILVDENNGQFLGGIEAVRQLLGLLKKLKWLQVLLSIQVFKPFAWLVYRIIAWHRYTWFIVPPYLRCSECELEIPKIWNCIFFIIFGLIYFTVSFANTQLWITSLAQAAPSLFKTISQTIWLQALLATFIASCFYVIFTFINFAIYQKALGVNKLEVTKQELLCNTICSVLVFPLVWVSNFQNPSLNLLIKSALLLSSLTIAQILVFGRFKQIEHGKFLSGFILFWSTLFRSLSPFIVFYFI